MKGLVSIHDLMPETMGRVESILDWLEKSSIPPATLLIVPGRPWPPRGIDRLRQLAEAGHELAAHGWMHKTKPRCVWHRIHAALISRNAAEHLDLDSAGIVSLMKQSHRWFSEQRLPEPSLYVPPAWALGKVNPWHLNELPYRQIETTSGLLQRDLKGGYKMQRLPLAGYEADTALRSGFLRKWNSWQAKSAERTNRPLRISLHPDDLNLRLRDQLEAQILAAEEFARYKTLGV